MTMEWNYDQQGADWQPALQCGACTEQSPATLDVPQAQDAATMELPKGILMDYRKPSVASFKLAYNKLGYKLTPQSGIWGKVKVDEKIYELKDMHFHGPAEHLIRYKAGDKFVRRPLEAHMVHSDSTGAHVVVSVTFVEGVGSALLDSLMALFQVSNTAWERKIVVGKDIDATTVNIGHFLGRGRRELSGEFIRYQGSLTTPPGTEGVTWFVLTEPFTASPEQLNRFMCKLKPGHSKGNYREETTNHNARYIVRGKEGAV